jgi:hypothetical protein
MPKGTKNNTNAAPVAHEAASYPTDEAMRNDGMPVLSQRIRHLASLGASTSEITKIVRRENGETPRYQHVRNVLNTPLKRAATNS